MTTEASRNAARWFEVRAVYADPSLPRKFAWSIGWLIVSVASLGLVAPIFSQSGMVQVLRRSDERLVHQVGFRRAAKMERRAHALAGKLATMPAADFCWELGIDPALVTGPGEDFDRAMLISWVEPPA